MPLVRAAIASFLFNRVLGAWDGSLGTIMTNRGAAVAGAAWPASTGEVSSGAGSAATPRRSRQASILRQGASPRGRRAWRHTGRKT